MSARRNRLHLKRGWWKPHFYEIFVLVNVIAMHTYLHVNGVSKHMAVLQDSFRAIFSLFVFWFVIGVVVNVVWHLIRGGLRQYWNHVGTLSWAIETARLMVVGLLAFHVYGWIKLTLPIIRPVLYDRYLWELDRQIFFGMSPSVFFVELFANAGLMRVVDWSYVVVFRKTLTAVFALGLSSASNRLRVALLGTKAMMWISGSWLYTTWVSLGPGYIYHEVWDSYRKFMPLNQYYFVKLYVNYRDVIALQSGERKTIGLLLGIAAFPSLHVAFQTYIALWMRRFSTFWGILAMIAAVIIGIGSVVTGWHYLVDSIAGFLLAIVFYLLNVYVLRTSRFARLRRKLRRETALQAIARRARGLVQRS